jgi:hypothetical protein
LWLVAHHRRAIPGRRGIVIVRRIVIVAHQRTTPAVGLFNLDRARDRRRAGVGRQRRPVVCTVAIEHCNAARPVLCARSESLAEIVGAKQRDERDEAEGSDVLDEGRSTIVVRERIKSPSAPRLALGRADAVWSSH